MTASPQSPRPRVWTLVPAAGIGARMQADRPKPYLMLGGRFLIDVTLDRLLAVPAIESVHLALHPEDRWWASTRSARSERIRPYTGGAERADSVRAGLDQIRDRAGADDWVLVHDVARPCIRCADVEALLTALEEHPVGGLLVAPMVDTIKEVDPDGTVRATADRDRLWRALTPQVFRFSVLDRALDEAHRLGRTVTDEASAVEALGLAPHAVGGRSDNIKVTVPGDLALVAWLLGRSGTLE